MRFLWVLFGIYKCLFGYNNAVGKSPILGWSTWYPYMANISQDLVINNTLEMISRGLMDAGYMYVNIDEGWILNRSDDGNLIYDDSKFPNGMYNLGEFIHSKGLKYGLYSSRGTVQCGSSHGYNAPGSYGYYKNDAFYAANMNADYFKLDSCGAVGNYTDAFDQYSQFGEYLNDTGRPIYYDLCGWNWYYATVGRSFSNSWRIAGDDGTWDSIINTFNIAYTGMHKYGNSYGWNNMDLLYSTNKNSTFNIGKITEQQARAQFSMYAVGSSNLIISNAIAYLSEYDIETYTNKILIDANQDLGPINGPSSGYKIYGINANNSVSIFGKKLSDGGFIAVFLNTMNTPQNIYCWEGCFTQMGFMSDITTLSATDVWTNKSLGNISRNFDYSYDHINGIIEVGYCTASDDQIFIYNSETNTIRAKLNNGIMTHIDCVSNRKMTTIITQKYNMVGCNGDEITWDIINVTQNIPANCNGFNCVHICNRLYEFDNPNGDKCLYLDTIKGSDFIWSFWDDGTIRDMSTCNKDNLNGNIDNNCRCLQLRSFYGESGFQFTAKDVPPNGGVQVIKFAPFL